MYSTSSGRHHSVRMLMHKSQIEAYSMIQQYCTVLLCSSLAVSARIADSRV